MVQTMKLYLRRLVLNNGGYANGRYFGIGVPVYAYMSDCGTVSENYLRAENREAAKEAIRKSHTNASFYR